MRLDRETGIVLLNVGGPASSDQVEPFLVRLFSDPLKMHLPWYLAPMRERWARRMARRRVEETRASYRAVGGESPILHITGAQANEVARRLGCEGYVAMRYAPPFAHETVPLMKEEGIRRAVVLSGYPQHSRGTSESSVAAFVDAWRASGFSEDDLVVIERWFDDEDYVSSVAETVRETLAMVPGGDCHVLFSAHGIPRRNAERGDTYVEEVRTTLQRVVEALELGAPHTLAFQGGVGSERWLEPSTEAAIAEIAAGGARNLVMVPLGFICDHIETLYEIDQLYARRAREHGMIFYRVPSLNDRPDFLDGLARLVHRRLTEAVECSS